MGRELTREESVLCNQAWYRREDDPDSDFFRCPWCKDPDLGEPETSAGDDPVGCRADDCEYLIATVGDGEDEEIVIGSGFEVLKEIDGLHNHPELGYGRNFGFLDEHPLVVSHTINGGGVGSGWALTCWWTKEPGDETLTQLITAYHDSLKVEAAEADAWVAAREQRAR